MTPPVSKFSPPSALADLSRSEDPKQEGASELETKLYFVSDNDSCFVQTRNTPKDYYTDDQLKIYFDRIMGWKRYSEEPISGVIWDRKKFCEKVEEGKPYACYDKSTSTLHLPIDKRRVDSLPPTIDHEEGHHLYWKEMEYEEHLAWTDLYEELVADPEKAQLLDGEEYQYRARQIKSFKWLRSSLIPGAPTVEYCKKNEDEAHSCMTSIFVNHPDEFQAVLKEKPEEVREFGERLFNFMKNIHFQGQDRVDLTPPEDVKVEEVSELFNAGSFSEKRCLEDKKDRRAIFIHSPEIWAGLNSQGRVHFVNAAAKTYEWSDEERAQHASRSVYLETKFLLQVFEEESQDIQEIVLMKIEDLVLDQNGKDTEHLAQHMFRFLNSPKEAVRNAAFVILIKSFDYNSLLQVFENETPDMQEKVLMELRGHPLYGESKNKKTLISHLLVFLDSPKEAVQEGAFYTLARFLHYDLSKLDLESQSAMVAVAKSYVSSYPNDKEVAEKVLINNLNKEEIAAFILRGENIELRRFAAFYLRNESVSMSVARPALHKALLDSDAKVRREAVISLAHRGNWEDLKYLRQLKRRERLQRVSDALGSREGFRKSLFERRVRRDQRRIHGRERSRSLVDQAIGLIQERSKAENSQSLRNRAASRRR